jgi:hypothetical protein
MDDLGRLLGGEHALVPGRPVDHGGKGRDQVTGVDDHRVEARPRHFTPLGHQPVADGAKHLRRELALESRLERAIARRVNRQVSTS